MTEQRDNQVRSREYPDPHEMNKPVPPAVIAIVAGLLLWAVSYIVSTGRDDDPTLGDRRTVATLEGKVKGAVSTANGADLYAANCVACHQASGAGLAGAFPPLAGSEWVAGPDNILANILLHGITGRLTVRGATYNGAMPSFKDKFDDREIAAVLSHIRANFGNTAPQVSANVVQRERAASKARTTPWNGDDELAKLK
ncbi:c-type cytochrome [Massilia sp. PWRC2]|uniref:c-type cytochrome n=1 Tax=Massilia sp. PWRC2 TaxID=2804626 RepID=UPI003CE7A66E